MKKAEQNQENIKKRLANLKPQKAGEPGHNPNGRPKKLPELEKLLIDNMTEEQNGLMAVDAIIKRLRAKAVQGDFKSAEYLLNRMYGKVKDELKVESDNITFYAELTKQERIDILRKYTKENDSDKE